MPIGDERPDDPPAGDRPSKDSPSKDSPSKDWELKAVLETLRRSAGPGRETSAQVFLKDTVAASDVEAVAQHALETMQARQAATGVPARLGKIHRLAKSFSVVAEPDAIAEIARDPAVKSILPSEIEDIYPKPVKPE